jgi:hypothetical protein
MSASRKQFRVEFGQHPLELMDRLIGGAFSDHGHFISAGELSNDVTLGAMTKSAGGTPTAFMTGPQLQTHCSGRGDNSNRHFELQKYRKWHCVNSAQLGLRRTRRNAEKKRLLNCHERCWEFDECASERHGGETARFSNADLSAASRLRVSLAKAQAIIGKRSRDSQPGRGDSHQR